MCAFVQEAENKKARGTHQQTQNLKKGRKLRTSVSGRSRAEIVWSGFNVREIGKEGKRGRGWLRFGIDEGGSGGCEVKRSQEKVKRVELGFTCMEIDKGVPSLSENSVLCLLCFKY